MPDTLPPEDPSRPQLMSAEQYAAFQAALADPASIRTHLAALQVLSWLDHGIAKIQMSLEVARLEAAIAPLSEERMAWARKAAYAMHIKSAQRYRVMRRDRELCDANRPPAPRRDPAEGVAKQQRLQAEALARKARRDADYARSIERQAELASLNSWRKRFLDLARERLPRDQFESWVAEAKAECFDDVAAAKAA